MGKKKSVNEEKSDLITEQMLKEATEMMQNIKGHYMSMTVFTAKLADNDWRADGRMKVGSTIDGDHWGEILMGVTGFDNDSNSALATVMVALNNYVNSPDFLTEICKKMVESLDKEPAIPELLKSEIKIPILGEKSDITVTNEQG